MIYLVTLQTKSTAKYDYQEFGSYFKTIEVKAKSEKEARIKVSKLAKERPELGYCGNLIVKLEERIEKTVSNPKKSKTWNQKLENLSNNYELMIKNRDKFVCDYIVLLTQKANQRERVDGYQLKKVGKKYQLFYKGIELYAPSDEDTMYSWFVRLPLRKLQIEADNWRIDFCDNITAK